MIEFITVRNSNSALFDVKVQELLNKGYGFVTDPFTAVVSSATQSFVVFVAYMSKES